MNRHANLLAAVLLLATAASTYGQDCWAIETDLKYNIPQGIYGTYGGCFKGTQNGQDCRTETGGMTRTEGSYGSLSACCDALEPRVKVDPRNGQPRTDQANIKAMCNSYKKTPPAGQPAPAPAPAHKPQGASQECFAIETDLKYNIPQGVYGTNGGCIKGTKSSDGSSCQVPRLDYTRAEGNYGSLSACCDALEPRVKVDPRNGQPRTDQANIKAVCNSYKKTPPAGQPAPAPAPAPKPQGASQECFAIETDLKYNIPQGVYGTNGGCIKGTKSSDGSSCQVHRLDYTRAEGNYGSLSACCDALEPRVKVDPRNGQPRTDQANIKAVCNSYKKTPPAGQPAPAPAPAPRPQGASQECFAIETDLKYNIPQGVYGTNGGCIKGTKSSDGSSCQVPGLGYTRAEGNYGSLSACCDALEPRVKVDPRNGQPRTDQANIKAMCNSYKKTPPAGQPAPAPAPAPKPQGASQECFAIETDLKYNIPQGVYGTNGGCIKGTKSSDGSSCQVHRLDYTRAEGNYGSLSACCDALEPRVKVDPRNGQPRTDQANIKAVCNSYKKTPPVAEEKAKAGKH